MSRLFWQLQQAGLVATDKSTVDVLVGLLDEAGLSEALGMAADLRAAGFNTESVLEPDRIGNQLKYAIEAGSTTTSSPAKRSAAAVRCWCRDLRSEAQQFVNRHALVATVAGP